MVLVEINLDDAETAINSDKIDSLPWSNWTMMTNPEGCRQIKGPDGPGLYQIRNSKTKENIQFGIGIKCQKRMQSLFPKPYGTGTRKNILKREYILANWKEIEFRTLTTLTKPIAKLIEDFIKNKKDHLFNT